MRELMLVRALRSLLSALVIASFAASAVAQERPQIVVVNDALRYLAERIVGQEADVLFPVPEGVDPSFWRPSIADISLIQSADLVLLNGASFATWVDRVSLQRSKVVNTSAQVKDQLIVTESITHRHGDGGEHSHEGVASYLWLDPTLAKAQAKAIAAAVVARTGLPEDAVNTQLNALASDLAGLDADTQKLLAEQADMPLIATHPRYQYFARRYGLTITSLEWDAAAAPSEAQLAELSALAADTGARILIWEAEPPPAAMDAVAALGLENVIFPPMASRTTTRDLVQNVTSAVRALADAMN